MTFEETVRLARIFVSLGVRKNPFDRRGTVIKEGSRPISADAERN